MKKVAIIGGIAAAVIVLVVCLVVLLPKGGTDQETNVVENVETTDEGQQNVSNSTLSVPDVRKQLLNPSEAKKGLHLHWYNNGSTSILAKTCPEGFVPGRIVCNKRA